MLKGIEVGDILGTFKEGVLLRAIQNEDMVESLKFTILREAILLDRTNPTAVEDFNKLIKTYAAIKDPYKEEENKQFIEDNREKLEKLRSLSLADLFKKNEPSVISTEKKDKIKII